MTTTVSDGTSAGRETPRSAQIAPGPGFRIRMTIDRPPAAVLDRLAPFETPDISDVLNRLYTMHTAIRNLTTNSRLAGPACTVKVYPGDNLMVHKALDVANAGDVVVVDAGASTMNGIVGDLITTKAKHRGIAGFIIDGLVRDLPAMQATGMPVFARGVTPIGPLHRGPGEINYTISCGGIVVNPGDIVLGDLNGVVVVRREFAEEIAERLTRLQEGLSIYREAVIRGDFSNEWVDVLLRQAGCTITD